MATTTTTTSTMMQYRSNNNYRSNINNNNNYNSNNNNISSSTSRRRSSSYQKYPPLRPSFSDTTSSLPTQRKQQHPPIPPIRHSLTTETPLHTHNTPPLTISQIRQRLISNPHHLPPTEAQLKWAQFHKRQRAIRTRDLISRLMLHPPSETDVAGAVTDDGDGRSSSEGSSDASEREDSSRLSPRRRRRRRPRVSRGRRALLRVSQRAYLDRKRRDENDPRRCQPAPMDASSSSRSAPRRESSPPSTTSTSSGRAKRFSDAYNAILHNMSSSQDPMDDAVSLSSTKRWTRPSTIAPAISVDGREYDDLQRGGSIRVKERRRREGGVVPEGVTRGEEMTSPGREKFQELLETAQQESAETIKSVEEDVMLDERSRKLRRRRNMDSLRIDTTTDESSSPPYSSPPDDETSSPNESLPYSPIHPLPSLSSSTHSPTSFSSSDADDDDLNPNDYTTIIDTDDHHPQSHHHSLLTLSLSPTILSKRLRQAIRTIHTHSWEKLSYLLTANPWLAEMTCPEGRLLLHHLARHGRTCPEDLQGRLVGMGGEARVDGEGNLPLHYAARSGNGVMVELLGDIFPAGASVRNEEGYLPLHLSVMSQRVDVVDQIQKLFPRGVGIGGGTGDLALHVAARVGEGEVVRCLVEGEWELEEEGREGSGVVRNEEGDTPLGVAVKGKVGWEVVEILLSGMGATTATLLTDSTSHTLLHHLLTPPLHDPASTLALLKHTPSLSTIPTPPPSSLIPIALAFQHSLPREVIFGLTLVDLPIDLDETVSPAIHPTKGGSWWYLTTRDDDVGVGVLKEILGLCSYHQTRELCFLKHETTGKSLISMASPRCKRELRRALRFVGRYEFKGRQAVREDRERGVKIFDALDYGEEIEGESEEGAGTRVYLKCFGVEESYSRDTEILRLVEMGTAYVERIRYFSVHDYCAYKTANAPPQFCIAVEKPDVTLGGIIKQMALLQQPLDDDGHCHASRDDYRSDPERLARFRTKIAAVLRLIGKALRYLHGLGVVHGDITVDKCGKFGEAWKVMDVTGAKMMGDVFGRERWGEGCPPESVGNGGLLRELDVEVTVDIWSFGKLMFDVFVGEELIKFDRSRTLARDVTSLRLLETWDQKRLQHVEERLINAGMGELGVDLIGRCLSPRKDDRPASMDDVLKHSFWRDVRKRGKNTTSSSSSSLKSRKSKSRRSCHDLRRRMEV